jgi:hypothetical protein
MKLGALLKWRVFDKRVISKGWLRKFCSEMLLQEFKKAEGLQKFNEITKIGNLSKMKIGP